jgi:hypothetical protein
MTPFEYVHQYHNFAVADPRLGLSFQTSITGYRADWYPDGATEMARLIQTLAVKYFPRASFKIPATFHIENDPRIDPSEEFFLGTLYRVFQSRGSPDEFRDAIRLAYLAGFCGKSGTPSAAMYCRTWFTNDCVSFAGNYQGVSSSTPVYAYAVGLTAAELAVNNISPDIRLSADVVHLPPRKRISDIAQGDLVLTFGRPDSRSIRWRHISVVESFAPLTDDTGLLSMAEWGGDVAAKHTSRASKVTLHDGSKIGRNAQDVYQALKQVQLRFKLFNPKVDRVLAFDGEAPRDGTPALRIFFDASSLQNIPSRGWQVAGKPAPI